MSVELKSLTDAVNILLAARLANANDVLIWGVVNHAVKYLDKQREEVLGRS